MSIDDDKDWSLSGVWSMYSKFLSDENNARSQLNRLGLKAYYVQSPQYWSSAIVWLSTTRADLCACLRSQRSLRFDFVVKGVL